jgi:hypothetical protein
MKGGSRNCELKSAVAEENKREGGIKLLYEISVLMTKFLKFSLLFIFFQNQKFIMVELKKLFCSTLVRLAKLILDVTSVKG